MAGNTTHRRCKGSRAESIQPQSAPALREVLRLLPQLRTDPTGAIDYAGSQPQTLVVLADHAETAMCAINLGLSAVGALLAYSAPEVEDGSVSSDSVESLGWLLSELGEVAAGLFVLSSHCRRETADFEPP